MSSQARLRDEVFTFFSLRRPTRVGEKRGLVLACGLAAFASLSHPALAHAQAEASGCAPTPALSSVPTISRSQLETFANLVDEPIGAVVERLRRDPTLIPVAAAAADIRLGRKRSGKWMMVGGFSLYGAGAFAAVYGILDHLGKQPFDCDGIGNPCYTPPMTSQDQALIYGGLVAVGVGLAIAIPGIIMAARQTNIETEAVTRYEHANGPYPTPYPPEGARTPSSGPGAPAISISLLAFSF